MAIGLDQKVTTTGLMGGDTKLPKAPDMSGLSQGQDQGQGQAPAPIAERPVKESPDQNIEEKLAGLTEEEKFKLDTILICPSLGFRLITSVNFLLGSISRVVL